VRVPLTAQNREHRIATPPSSGCSCTALSQVCLSTACNHHTRNAHFWRITGAA
jgi:hypothetical protein